MSLRLDSSLLNNDEMLLMERIIRSENLPALVDSNGESIDLPKPIFDALVHIVQQMKQGRSIVMMPEDETFTTQAAANFLGVSRQYFVNLIESGKISFHKVGSHRRVYFRDLLSYAKERDGFRRKTLDDLFDKVSDAGKYDSSYVGNAS